MELPNTFGDWCQAKDAHCIVAMIHNDPKCDMIKGNELDVGHINFDLQAKRSDKLLYFTLFLNFTELFISLQPDVRLRWSVNQNIAF